MRKAPSVMMGTHRETDHNVWCFALFSAIMRVKNRLVLPHNSFLPFSHLKAGHQQSSESTG
jgi:hypothetical protein